MDKFFSFNFRHQEVLNAGIALAIIHESYDDMVSCLSFVEALCLDRCVQSLSTFLELCSRHDKKDYFDAMGVDVDFVRMVGRIDIQHLNEYHKDK